MFPSRVPYLCSLFVFSIRVFYLCSSTERAPPLLRFRRHRLHRELVLADVEELDRHAASDPELQEGRPARVTSERGARRANVAHAQSNGSTERAPPLLRFRMHRLHDELVLADVEELDRNAARDL